MCTFEINVIWSKFSNTKDWSFAHVLCGIPYEIFELLYPTGHQESIDEVIADLDDIYSTLLENPYDSFIKQWINKDDKFMKQFFLDSREIIGK